MNYPNVLVHLHLFYHDQMDYFIEKLRNISGVNWHLVVTFSVPSDKVFEKIRCLKPDTEFIPIDNIGYDIWPFINVIKSVDLDKYDYVVKLHTKRSVKRCAANVIMMRGYEWRDALVDGILFDKTYFSKVIAKLEANLNVGMISNLKTFSKRNWETYSPWIKDEMARLGLSCTGDHFCMGTMFIARAKVLKPLQSGKITKDMFADTVSDDKRDFTSAHYYERLLSVLPSAFRLRHIPMSPKKNEAVWIKSVRALEKPVRWIFGIEKKGPEKRKFIRILGLEFFIQKSSRPPKSRKGHTDLN